MKKLGNTNDQNKLKRQALDSPLCTLIKKSWRDFDEDIKDSKLSEEDVLRYVLWAIEIIKGGEDDIVDCCKNLRHSVLSRLRDKRISSEEIDYITNTICAYTLLCLDQAYMYSLRNDLQNVCTIAENSIKKNQIENVQKYKRQIRGEMNLLEIRNDFQEWCSDYLLNDRFYTTEDARWIEATAQSLKTEGNSSSRKDKDSIPYTLYYLCKDDSIRVKRIGFVRRKWEEWEWLEVNTDVTDFEHFFSGKSRDCQLIWKASNAILSLLITQLLDNKDCFGHKTGCSPRSVVINQFKKSYDTHTERVDKFNKLRIEWTVKLLNYKVSLELPQLPYHQGEDISDRALQEIYAGNMHITKDLNMYKD